MSKEAGIELLTKEHFDQKNPWDAPVVGWLPTSEGEGSLVNPKGWSMLRSVLWKMIDGQRTPLYDQPLIVENAGAIIIPQVAGRVGLVKNFRMTGDRLIPNAGSEYIRRLNAEKRWSELLASLGQWKWEAPRGLITKPIEEDLAEFVIRSAKMEAMEEAGFNISEARLVGRVNANSTFFPHSQWVVDAKIESIGNAKPEDLEILGTAKLFSATELRQMANDGELDDAITLAGLALCGITF